MADAGALITLLAHEACAVCADLTMDQIRYNLESADGVNKFGGVLTILHQETSATSNSIASPKTRQTFEHVKSLLNFVDITNISHVQRPDFSFLK